VGAFAEPELEEVRAELIATFLRVERLEEAMPPILEALCRSLGWEMAGAWVVDEPGRGLRCAGYWHADAPGLGDFAVLSRELRFDRQADLIGAAWSRRETIWRAELPSPAEYRRAIVAGSAGIASGAWTALLCGEHSIGALELLAVESRPSHPRLVPHLIEVGRRLGELIVLRLEEQDVLIPWGALPGSPRRSPFRGLPQPGEW
jgi:GAF domain-containing protein